jgi:hypothetical protein
VIHDTVALLAMGPDVYINPRISAGFGYLLSFLSYLLYLVYIYTILHFISTHGEHSSTTDFGKDRTTVLCCVSSLCIKLYTLRFHHQTVLCGVSSRLVPRGGKGVGAWYVLADWMHVCWWEIIYDSTSTHTRCRHDLPNSGCAWESSRVVPKRGSFFTLIWCDSGDTIKYDKIAMWRCFFSYALIRFGFFLLTTQLLMAGVAITLQRSAISGVTYQKVRAYTKVVMADYVHPGIVCRKSDPVCVSGWLVRR